VRRVDVKLKVGVKVKVVTVNRTRDAPLGLGATLMGDLKGLEVPFGEDATGLGVPGFGTNDVSSRFPVEPVDLLGVIFRETVFEERKKFLQKIETDMKRPVLLSYFWEFRHLIGLNVAYDQVIVAIPADYPGDGDEISLSPPFDGLEFAKVVILSTRLEGFGCFQFHKILELIFIGTTLVAFNAVHFRSICQ
jgi:hypothetical protein